ncbi:MAG: hypothetical protein Q4P15_01970 [Propionibacteriaceae bacterium]|nr:hypothetical protein [Propionibacteriaceae bacterium]
MVNGREWRTTCEPYSQTQRCRTDILSTLVTETNGVFTATTVWHFNTLTYAGEMPRSAWAGNPLATTGSWTASDGRRWRTECDTEATGGNGCRSYIWASLITATRTSAGWSYKWTQDWVVNIIVRFR